MKLDLECMKNTMAALEDILTVDDNGIFHCAAVREVCMDDRIRGTYTRGEVLHTLLQLHESGYIVSDLKVNAFRQEIALGSILYITPKGYDFLAASRESRVWNATKDAMKAAGLFSMKALEVAMSAAVEGYIRGRT